jgi:hypothetical protein
MSGLNTRIFAMSGPMGVPAAANDSPPSQIDGFGRHQAHAVELAAMIQQNLAKVRVIVRGGHHATIIEYH